MVLVRLKGVHSVRVKLAGGKTATYHYAWRGGPRLPDDKNGPGFTAAFNAAHAARKKPKTGTLTEIITAFKAGDEYEALSAPTKRAYARYLDLIGDEFGALPLAALDDPRLKGDIREWRGTMRKTPRSADYAISTLRRLLAWAVDGGLIATNPAAEIKRLHSADRSESVWSEDDFKAFAKVASDELWQAVQLASLTGLRQGDLIRMTWTNYDGESFALRTSKRGKNVTIPATQECRALLRTIRKRQAVILTTARTGTPWTADGLRSSFSKACKDARVKRTFHDLRRTACTRLLVHGLPNAQVALIMGWSEDEIDALKRRYVSRSAVVKSMLANMGEAE